MAERPEEQKQIDSVFPYERFRGTQLWNDLTKAVNDLAENQDIKELTQRDYIIGYLCKCIKDDDSSSF